MALSILASIVFWLFRAAGVATPAADLLLNFFRAAGVATPAADLLLKNVFHKIYVP